MDPPNPPENTSVPATPIPTHCGSGTLFLTGAAPPVPWSTPREAMGVRAAWLQ